MTLRSDASRNREAIIDHAIALLAEDPDASLQTIADAASVTRMTVYRHFPNRGALILAVSARVTAGLDDLMARMADPALPLDAAIGLLVDFTVAAALEYRALIDPAMLDAAARAVVEDEPVLPVLVARRDRGEVRADLEPRWLAVVLRAVLLTAVKELARPETDPAAVRTATVATLLGVLRPT